MPLLDLMEAGRQRLVTSAEGQPMEGKMPLPDNGWTDKQARGLFESLNLDGGTPKWKWEHLHRLRSWCSAREKDSATIDGQLEFIAADLCDTCEGPTSDEVIRLAAIVTLITSGMVGCTATQRSASTGAARTKCQLIVAHE